MGNNKRMILFVCTGNSCRSIMAEGLLKKALKGLGKGNFEVSSAGTGARDGFTPTFETIEVMKEEGVDVSGYKSKRLTDELINEADLILVMEAAHKEDIAIRVPEAAPKTYLLKEFGLEKTKMDPEYLGVPDPIGRPMEVYEASFNAIKREIERIAPLL